MYYNHGVFTSNSLLVRVLECRPFYNAWTWTSHVASQMCKWSLSKVTIITPNHHPPWLLDLPDNSLSLFYCSIHCVIVHLRCVCPENSTMLLDFFLMLDLSSICACDCVLYCSYICYCLTLPSDPSSCLMILCTVEKELCNSFQNCLFCDILNHFFHICWQTGDLLAF